MKRFQYAKLSVVASGVNCMVVLAGCIFICLINSIGSSTSNSGAGMKFGMYFFVLSIAAVFVVSIYQFLYYVFEERKQAILIGAIASIVVFLMYLFTITSIIGSLFSLHAISSLLGSGSYGVSKTQIIFPFIVSIAGMIVNGAITLQMAHVIHLPFLTSLMPVKASSSQSYEVGVEKDEPVAPSVEEVKLEDSSIEEIQESEGEEA